MVVHYSETRKIDPTKGNVLGDNTPNDKNRIEIGPTQLAFEEWDVAGLWLPDLRQMRRFRLERLTQHIVDRGYGGLGMERLAPIWCLQCSTPMSISWKICRC